MRCEDAVDSVSALCDGKRIPREAAKHIGECATCRARLQDYAMLGAELRRTASLQSFKDTTGNHWLLASRGTSAATKHTGRIAIWWNRGAEAMRIPRFAFALMVLGIVVLSSGLVVVGARSTWQGPVVLVTLKPPMSNSSLQCALPMSGNQSNGGCDGLMRIQNGGTLAIGMRLLAKQGDKITLGIRSQFFAGPPNGSNPSNSGLRNLPMERYELEPGQKVDVDIEGLGEGELTAESLDYMPTFPMSPGEALEPRPDELRMVSPLLLRGSEAVLDMAGNSTQGTAKNGAVWIYAPHVGRLIISTENFQGAVKGEVSQSRVDFEIGGQRYQLLAGAPMTRAPEVWVQLDPNFQPSRRSAGVFGFTPLEQLLPK